jgi:hypothetical protein
MRLLKERAMRNRVSIFSPSEHSSLGLSSPARAERVIE